MITHKIENNKDLNEHAEVIDESLFAVKKLPGLGKANNMDIRFWFKNIAGNTRSGCCLLAGLVLTVTMLPVLAAESDYMDQLESEAAESSDLAVPGEFKRVRQEKFEYLLKAEKPSTFEVYSKLNPENQTIVVDNFARNKRLSLSSKLIVDLYFDEK